MTDSNRSTGADSMQAILAQLSASLDRLHGILQEEADRLSQRQIDGVDSLLADKQAALQALEALEAQRRELLAQAGFDGGDSAMRRYLRERCDASLLPAWEAILDTLRRVQALNEANGRIIHRSLEQTTQILAILRGEDGQNPLLYGPSGRPNRGGGSSLAKA